MNNKALNITLLYKNIASIHFMLECYTCIIKIGEQNISAFLISSKAAFSKKMRKIKSNHNYPV